MDQNILIDLQRFARGYLVRRRFHDSVRNELTFIHNKIGNYLCDNVKLFKIGCILINDYFCSKNNFNEISKFCDILFASMKCSSIQESFASLYLSTNHMDSACKLTFRLFQRLLEEFEKSNVSKISDSRRISSQTPLLYIFCNCSEDNWPILKGKEQIIPIINSLCAKMLYPIATIDSLNILKKIICDGLKGDRRLLDDKTIDLLFFISIRFIQISSIESDLTLQIFIEFISLPTIAQMLSKQTLNLIESTNIFENSIKWLASKENNKISSLSTNEALNLIGNIIFFGNLFKKSLAICLLDWAYLVNRILKYCAFIVTDNKKSNCWHHPLLGWTSERIDGGYQWAFTRMIKQISLLWSKEMLEFLAINFFTNFDETKLPEQNFKRKSSKSLEIPTFPIDKLPSDFLQKFIGKFGSKKHQETIGSIQAVALPPFTPPIIFCQLYQNALLAFYNSRIEILSSLSRNDSLVLAKLWHYINPDVSNTEGFETCLGYLVTDPSVTSPHFAPLQLFGEISYSLISILDEREMYETEKPFTRVQLCQIATFANRFCFHAIWDSLIDFDNRRSSLLFTSMYQLLNILFNRDCRRQFTPSKHFWTIPEISFKAFVAEFEKNETSKRAQLLMEKMPHIIPLRDRIFLFRKFIQQDKESFSNSNTIITVERSRIIEDGYRQLGGINTQTLKGVIRVKFINQQGLDEAGIDQDGVFKEFLEQILKKVFVPELNLFKYTHDKMLYPSPTSNIQENHLELFKFVGCMLGKAIYEGICVDVQLAPVLLASVLNKQLYPFDELASLDPILYKNLTFVKHYNDSEDVEDLALTFSFQEKFLGKIYTHELLPGGRELKVNNENKISYLHLYSHYRVIKQVKSQTISFVNGFRSIIKEKWLSLFNTHELQFLISGQLSDIDLDDLKKHVQYYGGFHSNHRLIRWFWSIVQNDFNCEERHLFLKFVTSCSRPPLLGFAYLEPPFSIRCVETSDDLDHGDTLGSVIRGFLAINKRKQPTNERLPTASTCFNLLKLPNYTRRQILLEKLRYAIHAETGFELS
ncbi:hypothetical protein ACQ4LE_009425 [Meloidogyne hapla]|uniref:HECT-type E3 ubiquitin transferase n=1 Tax=Meloidogyne hapla TaxID=6305 RepID=A0A1I8BDB6_MELHA